MASPIVAVVCYIGILAAVPFTELLPFNVLKWLTATPPSLVYWIGATIIFVAIVMMTLWAGFACIRQFRMHCIDVEVVLGFAGSVLGTYGAWHILPTGL